MKWKRLSLFYLAGYLLMTGLGFLFLPDQSLKLLGATGSYGDIFVRLVGAFMIALGTLIVQIIHHRLEVLYKTTVLLRFFFIAVVTWLYVITHDPLFLVVLAVVTLGVTLTLLGFFLDQKQN